MVSWSDMTRIDRICRAHAQKHQVSTRQNWGKTHELKKPWFCKNYQSGICYFAKDHDMGGKTHRHICAFCLSQGRISNHADKDCHCPTLKQVGSKSTINQSVHAQSNDIQCFLNDDVCMNHYCGENSCQSSGECMKQCHDSRVTVRSRVVCNSKLNRQQYQSLLARDNSKKCLLGLNRGGDQNCSRTTRVVSMSIRQSDTPGKGECNNISPAVNTRVVAMATSNINDQKQDESDTGTLNKGNNNRINQKVTDSIGSFSPDAKGDTRQASVL